MKELSLEINYSKTNSEKVPYVRQKTIREKMPDGTWEIKEITITPVDKLPALYKRSA